MGRQLYIADWHYDHANCIAFDNRPFNDVQEMNEELIKRWNEAVSENDTVYILGDMFWCNWKDALPVLDKLNGRKILIKGNHDRCNESQFVGKFSKIVDYLEIKDNGRNVVLCHYPIPCFKNHFYGWYHLYGHVHNSFEANMMEHCKKQMIDLYGKMCNMYNVGAMHIGYAPKTLDEIIEIYRVKKEN